MSAFGFNENDAKRIGRAVRAVERDQNKVRLGGPNAEGAAPGVRLLLGKYEGSSWPAGSTAVVTIYNGEPGNLASGGTTVAYNAFVSFGNNTQCTARWVALGHNGFAWNVVEQKKACTATCTTEVSGLDFSALPGYASGRIQLLGHSAEGGTGPSTDAFCQQSVASLRWYDVTTCVNNA